MSATLKNVSTQPVVLVLDHEAFATRANGWQRTTAKFGAQDASGTRNVTEVRRTYPGSLTIFPGESVSGLHAAIVYCSQVPQLIARKVLVASYQEDAAPEVVVPGIQPAVVVDETSDSRRKSRVSSSEG